MLSGVSGTLTTSLPTAQPSFDDRIESSRVDRIQQPVSSSPSRPRKQRRRTSVDRKRTGDSETEFRHHPNGHTSEGLVDQGSRSPSDARSSPAMQAAPVSTQAPASLSSHVPPGSSSSAGQQYYPSPSQPRERQQAFQTVNNASSPSSRRAARRGSGNAAQATTPSTPQGPQFYASNGSSPAESNSTTPRNLPLPPSKHTSPSIGTDAVGSGGFETISGQLGHQDGPPVQPPPRSSSHQQSQQANSPSSSRKPPRGDERASSSRPATAEDRREQNHVTEPERERVKDDTTSAAALAARSRRKAQQPARQDRSPRPSPATESRSRQSPQTGHGRSPTATRTASASENNAIPREGSAVLNRVNVSDPQDDLERERERQAEARPSAAGTDLTPVTGLGLVGDEGVDDGGRGAGRSRQDHSASASRRKETRFGEYILGQTLGEGEFGKVKMGWKKEGGVQVAIKLIRRESLGSNPTRLPKIYREIAILREVSHPNIVRLHEMVETDRHIGIILEYASGGELFDYILNHRYLKDQAARRLFAQLVSGVGYLHKKGIVHRDLKLENLLLDRNRNIIITDFGFANTFDPVDELGDEIEFNLTNKDFVKQQDLERIQENGYRRGDLMQTSCGSPCYAAPELVVSDSLYTGRKVDVWSCGVILYAMLAGYLPFDDDPANPEGDNINLLYKYIVSTPLTFPEYVTPHARDLLRRILVPDPRKRADLFEVARHSWLSDYAHVVSFITSSTTTTGDISNTTVTADDHQDGPLLARSASVREPSKPHQSHVAAVGGLSQKHGRVDQDGQGHQPKPQRDAKRRTVQVEYVAPQSQTARGESGQATHAATTTTPRARSSNRDAVEPSRTGSQPPSARTTSSSRPLPHEPSGATSSRQASSYQNSPVPTRTQQRPTTQNMEPPSRPARDGPRAVSDSIGAFGTATIGQVSTTRPTTGGSMSGHRPSTMGVPSRGSYSRPGQPAAPAVAATNAQGRLAQPKNGKHYVISNPIPQGEDYIQNTSFGRPTSMAPQPRVSNEPRPMSQNLDNGRGHKRSNTVGGLSERLFGRTGSVFGGGRAGRPSQDQSPPQKSYPPTSMQAAMSSGSRRPSTDSHRSTSFGFGRKNSNLQDKPRRFSLLGAFSSKNSSGVVATRDTSAPARTPGSRGRAEPRTTAYGRGQTPDSSRDSVDAGLPYDGHPRASVSHNRPTSGISQPKRRQASTSAAPQSYDSPEYGGTPLYHAFATGPLDSGMNTESETSLAARQTPGLYPPGFNSHDDEPRRIQGRDARGPSVLTKNNRRFADAYEHEQDSRYSANAHSSGSSGAARKVMDFFRRRGKARAGDER